MRIGQLAQIVGVRASTIRYYEDAGLVVPPPRISGRRDYGRESVDRLKLILAAQQAGFTLTEIRDLVSLLRGNNPSGQGWSEIARAKLEKLDTTISRLRRARRALARAIDCTCAGVAADCRLVESFPSRSTSVDKIGLRYGNR